MSSFLKTSVRPAEDVSEQATDDLLSLVRQASEGSKREIDLLIKELTGLQKKLDDDRERAHQQVAQYTSLSQSTLQLTKNVLDQIPYIKKQSNPEP